MIPCNNHKTIKLDYKGKLGAKWQQKDVGTRHNIPYMHYMITEKENKARIPLQKSEKEQVSDSKGPFPKIKKYLVKSFTYEQTRNSNIYTTNTRTK